MPSLKFIICILYVFNFVFSSNLPSSVTPCNRNDVNLNDCILKEARKWIKDFARGIPELDVPEMTHLNLGNFSINFSGGRMMTDLNNFVTKGLENSDIKQINFNFDRKTIFIESVLNSSTEALYRLKGYLFNVPLNNNGTLKADFHDLKLNWTMNWETHKQQNGKDYIRIKSVTLVHLTKSADIKIEGFQSQELGLIVNRVINENWSNIEPSFTPPITKSLAVELGKILNKFFSKIPLDELFTS